MKNPCCFEYTGFHGFRRIASGPLAVVALAVRRAIDSGAAGTILIIDNASGRPIDIDLRGSDHDIRGRFSAPAPTWRARERSDGEPGGAADAGLPAAPADALLGARRGRGRPKLGVVSREVTLLPRQWEWLAAQSGGASVALRKLVEAHIQARAAIGPAHEAKTRAYHFMAAIAGDLAGFEEAVRALFAGDRPRLLKLIANWPADVRDHAAALALDGPGRPVHGEP
ncbi:DUF2239 family protein [Burkholderia multivorans]|uniref:DUF2239 family protein n=1 Tax=Burkholderia ubonensis TaxID=101571 RepID=UPI000F6B6577|nr:DUF2239 family protein [Burkholderia ubonensis]AYZ64943.1 DUF2239 family protein [Burkholderia multivorans]VWB09523.1 hypothetical protein BUB20358_00260 [Burkholderia ubonensis]